MAYSRESYLDFLAEVEIFHEKVLARAKRSLMRKYLETAVQCDKKFLFNERMRVFGPKNGFLKRLHDFFRDD